MSYKIDSLFSVSGKVAVITGSTGVLGKAMAIGLGINGASVVITGHLEASVATTVTELQQKGLKVVGKAADVTDRASVEALKDFTLKNFGRVDILINCAGGNVKEATIGDDESFFDMSLPGVEKVMKLNFSGTLLPCIVFGKEMIKQETSSIITISSMAAEQATISRVMGYSASKAAISNFTHWLASDLGRKHKGKIRVNAIAPGFFIGDQNRDLLLQPDGNPTARGQTILKGTPMERFGNPEELLGTVLWLCSDASRFVTGTVTQVDGGFSSFSGV